MRNEDVLVHYCRMVNAIFGSNTLRAENIKGEDNLVTMTLNSDQFDDFKRNFRSRLARLHNTYKASNSLPALISKLKNVALGEWDGHFAELAALDFFNHLHRYEDSFLLDPVEIDKPVDPAMCLVPPKGEARTPDGYFEDFDVYYDSKTLKDVPAELLRNVYRRVAKEEGISRFPAVPDFDLDADWTKNSVSVANLVAEIRGKLHERKGQQCMESEIVSGLRHHIRWEPAVTATGGGYSPYRHAEESHHLVFKKATQAVLTRPFILVMVVFPWWNNIITDFAGMNATYYRAVARRVFCGYLDCNDPLQEVFPMQDMKDVATIPAKDVSRTLSAILFLEDHSITASKQQDVNISGYLYANPNARNRLTSSMFWDYAISDLCLRHRDDFEYDNY